MNKCSSVFGQILQIFNRYEFERMVSETHSEKGTKGFSSWDQFVAMLFCQLGQYRPRAFLSQGFDFSH